MLISWPSPSPWNFLTTWWVNKKETPYSCPYLHQILTDFKNSFTGILSRKFTIKLSIKILPRLMRVATLPCEITIRTNLRHHNGRYHARAHWGYYGHGRRTGIKPRRPATNLSFSMLHSTMWCSRCHFSPWSWFEETLLNNWLKQSCNARLKTVAWMMLASCGSRTKICSLWPHWKNHRMIDCTHLWQRTKMSEKNAFFAQEWRSVSRWWCLSKCTKQAWYFSTRVKINEIC